MEEQLFVKLVKDRKILTGDNLTRLQEIQGREEDGDKPLWEVAVHEGWITSDQMEKILAEVRLFLGRRFSAFFALAWSTRTCFMTLTMI